MEEGKKSYDLQVPTKNAPTATAAAVKVGGSSQNHITVQSTMAPV